MRFIIQCCFLCASAAIIPRTARAQGSAIVVKTAGLEKEREARFVNEVKLLDEFIERFNDAPNSYLRKAYKAQKRPFTLTRSDLIQSLFNNPTSWAAKPQTKAFIRQVTDSATVQFLATTDTGWYADARCVFNYRGKPLVVPLVLRMVTAEDSSTTWMIAGIGSAPALDQPEAVDTAGMTSEPADRRHYIPSTGHSTNFLALHKVFTPAMNPANYFLSDVLQTDRCAAFIRLVKAGRLKFQNTKAITFHFFQVPGYAFSVERFERNGANSGWLINSLTAVDEAEKTAQRSALLQRPL